MRHTMSTLRTFGGQFNIFGLVPLLSLIDAWHDVCSSRVAGRDRRDVLYAEDAHRKKEKQRQVLFIPHFYPNPRFK